MDETRTYNVESATKTHGDSAKDLDGVSASRWVKHGNDRLYINGLFVSTKDVYVDLTDDTVTVSGTQTRSATAERDGDTLVVEIVSPSWNYEIIVGSEDADDTDTGTDTDEDEDDEGGVDLEELGIGL